MLIRWVIGLTIALFIGMLIIPIVFDGAISGSIKKGLNKKLKTELQFKQYNISFFRHFPALTFSLEETQLTGSPPFTDQPLITARELGFGINILKLIFSRDIEINKTYLTDCNIRLIKDKYGRINYDVYSNSDSLSTEKDTSHSTGLNLALDQLKIQNTNLFYKDEGNGITLMSDGLNYRGKGGLDEGKLELGSRLEIEKVDLVFDNIEYLKGKKLKAKSFIRYDTKTLSIELDKNTIALNDLNIDFDGKLDIFDEGLAYDLIANSQNGSIQDFVSSLPPEYVTWSKEVDLQGDLDATLHLTGYSGIVPDTLEKERTVIDLGIQNGRIAHKMAEEPVENLFITLKGSMEGDRLDFRLDTLHFTLNEEVTSGNMVVQGSPDSFFIKSDLLSAVNLNILNRTLHLPDIEFDGKLSSKWNINGVYHPGSSVLPRTEGRINLTNGFLRTPGHPEPIKDIEIDAIAKNEGSTYSESSIQIAQLDFSFIDNPFTAKAFFKDFDNPEYQIICLGNIDFTSLNQVVRLPFLFSDGSLKADLKLQGQLYNPDDDTSRMTKPSLNSGTLEVFDIRINSDILQYPLSVVEGKFLFLNEKMAFSKLDLQHGSSQLTLNGYFQKYLDYMLFSKGILHGNVNLSSPSIDITEFFPKEEKLSTPAEQQSDSLVNIGEAEEQVNGVMPVPEDLDLVFQVEIDSLKYNSLHITSLSGIMSIKDRGLFLKNTSFNMVDGTSHLEGFYHPVDSQKALFSMGIDAKQLNIKEGYETIELFRELVPAAERASGRVSLDYNLSGAMDHQMLPILPSLEGEGTLMAHDVRFNGYKLLGELSKKSGFNELNDPAVSGITIHSSIKNNILNLERFKFKVRPFRLRAEGQTSLDGELNLKMRLGLPPFGIIGIPVVITGPGNDFDIKLGKKSSDLDELENTEDDYSEEELKRLSLLRDSIRSGMSLDEIDSMQLHIESLKLDSLNVPPPDTLKVQ